MSNLFANFGSPDSLIYILFCTIAGLIGYLIADSLFSKKYKKLEDDFSSSKIELDTLKIHNETLAKQIKLATPESEVNDLRNRLKSAEDNKIKADGDYAAQLDAFAQMKTQFGSLQAERDQLKAEAHTKTTMSETQIAEVQDTLNKTKDKITEIAAENEALRKELETYKNTAAPTPASANTERPNEAVSPAQTPAGDDEPLKTPYGDFDVNKEPALTVAAAAAKHAELPGMKAPPIKIGAPDATIPPVETPGEQRDILKTPYGDFPVSHETSPSAPGAPIFIGGVSGITPVSETPALVVDPAPAHTDAGGGAHSILPATSTSAPEISTAATDTPATTALQADHTAEKIAEAPIFIGANMPAAIQPDQAHPSADSADAMKTPYGDFPLNGLAGEQTPVSPAAAEPASRDINAAPATPIPTLYQPAESVHAGQHKQISSPDYSHTDDLKKIEGIGPEAEQALKKAGISNWRELSAVPVSRLKEITAASGDSVKNCDPTYWPEQAIYLANGEFDKYEKLKQYLTGGSAPH